MPESYPFPMYSGLLEPEHYKKIGSALWLFLWCISSTTKEVERDGVTWGIVLGNKPLTRTDLAKPFGVSERTIQRWLDDLEKYGYIKITRAPYGYVLTVKNSKKYKKERVDKNVHSERDKTKMSSPEWTETSSHVDKNVHSNKDITKINNTTTNITKDSVDLIAEKYADLKTIQYGKPCYPSSNDYQVIAQIVALGVPSTLTIELLERGFKDFHERKPRGKIKSFSYFQDFILEQYEIIIAKNQAKETAKNSVSALPINNTKSYQPRKRRSKPIRTEQLPDWFEEDPYSNEQKQPVNDPESTESKKKELEDILHDIREPKAQ